MNALYLVLIIIGFSAGIIMAGCNKAVELSKTHVDKTEEILIDDNLIYKSEAETNTFNILNSIP